MSVRATAHADIPNTTDTTPSLPTSFTEKLPPLLVQNLAVLVSECPHSLLKASVDFAVENEKQVAVLPDSGKHAFDVSLQMLLASGRDPQLFTGASFSELIDHTIVIGAWLAFNPAHRAELQNAGKCRRSCTKHPKPAPLRRLFGQGRGHQGA